GVMSQKFVVRGNMDEEAIAGAFEGAIGHFARMRSSLMGGGRRRLIGDTENFQCDENALQNALMNLAIITKSEAEARWPHMEYEVVVCSMWSDCAAKQLERAAAMLRDSSKVNLYAGLESIDIAGPPEEGCPHEDDGGYHAGDGDHYPDFTGDSSSVRMVVLGSWDEEVIKNLLHKAFGEDVFMDAHLLSAGDGTAVPSPEGSSPDGGTVDGQCDQSALADLLQALPMSAGEAGERKKAEVTICGGKERITCIRQMLVRVHELTASSSDGHGGIELMAPLGQVEEGCPVAHGPDIPPSFGDQPLESVSWVLRGYHDIDDLGEVFRRVTGEDVLSHAEPFYPSKEEPEGETTPTEEPAGTQSSGSGDCPVGALTRAIEGLGLNSEAEAKAMNRAHNEHIVTACGAPERIRCILSQLRHTFNKSRELPAGSLLGGLSGGRVVPPGVQEGCPLLSGHEDPNYYPYPEDERPDGDYDIPD
ncbi:hypothetical protein FOZ63_008443, partial [Perkinsus olseni]